MSDTAQILVNLYDGSRNPLPNSIRWRARISDGRSLSDRHTDTYNMQGASALFQVKFFDNLFDAYTVIASPDGYEDSGWFPVHVHPARPERVDLMALVKNGQPSFGNATWAQLSTRRPQLAEWFVQGCQNLSADDKYGQVLENRPLALACFLNITTAMADMRLPSGRTPLDYYWNLSWPAGDPGAQDWLARTDGVFKQDRFFCYVEDTFLDDIREAADHGAFAAEPHPETFHDGATESYKQTQFDVSNVQLTFHGRDTCKLTNKTGQSMKCIKIEPDMDYYKDLLAHGLLEVLPNSLEHKLTDPRVAYVLRWMAGQRAGLPMYNPLYTVE